MSLGKACNRGIMFHIAHLPAYRSCIGQFNDPDTDKFIDFLEASRQTHWIINPLTPLGEDLSPYNASSRFDRNKYLINLNQLATLKYGNLLTEEDLPDDIDTEGFTLQMLQQQKDPRFETAFKRFKKLSSDSRLKTEFIDYCTHHGDLWLNNNAIYEGLVHEFGYEWKNWPEPFKCLPENTQGHNFDEKIDYLKSHGLANEKAYTLVGQFMFEQFIFSKQFNEFKQKLDQRNIKLFVDLAYAISFNGKDVWVNKNIVELNSDYKPLRETGAPPEPAYPITQRWGSAVWNYNSSAFWKYQENSIRYLLKEGCVRIDHFGGLINRVAIPSSFEHPHTQQIVSINNIFTEFGSDFWIEEWLEDVIDYTNPQGENLIDLYLRVAQEEKLSPAEAFIVEDLGCVCATKRYAQFMEENGALLAGLRNPITDGIGLDLGVKDLNCKNNFANPYNIQGGVENIAIITSSHDTKTLLDTIDFLLDNEPEAWDNGANSPFHFRMFLKNALEISEEEWQNRVGLQRRILQWIYEMPAKHVQITISDALGIYFRPNMPGYWNGSEEKWCMKNSLVGLFKFWGRQFPKGFLERDNRSGIRPGYKSRVDEYVHMMNELFPITHPIESHF